MPALPPLTPLTCVACRLIVCVVYAVVHICVIIFLRKRFSRFGFPHWSDEAFFTRVSHSAGRAGGQGGQAGRKFISIIKGGKT